MPYCVGLSGGIAAGKSLLCGYLSAGDIEIIDADGIARELVTPGQPALKEIGEQFGNRFIGANGALDRAGLRTHIFSDASEKIKLEAILHPRIQTALLQRAECSAAAIVVVAIPLLSPQLRSTVYRWLQRILLIEAPRHVQRQRIVARDACSMETAEAILAAQLTRAQRLPMAHDVLINDAEPENVQRWAHQLQMRYRQLAQRL